MGGAAECADQLGDFEVHWGGEDAQLTISYFEDTASGYEELYIDYHDGYTTDEGEPVWYLLRCLAGLKTFDKWLVISI